MRRTALTGLFLAALVLTGCNNEQGLAGTYDYIGWNGMTNAEEIWNLEIAEDNTYTLSLVNDFLNAENYGNVVDNGDDTYTLIHTSSKDPNFPYPAIVHGFVDVSGNGSNDWRCKGTFDFEAMTFTPIVENL